VETFREFLPSSLCEERVSQLMWATFLLNMDKTNKVGMFWFEHCNAML
jgi:hypothetical protein